MKNVTAGDMRAMLIAASAALEANKKQINDLNVFPVPDGDTGTNMSLTMAAAAAEMRKNQSPALGKTAEAAASALLRGARGNSGVILSLLFRGISRSLRDRDEAGPAAWAEAMAEGVSAAYKAVMKPAEGTILTVSRLASEAAKEAAAAGANIEETLAEALAEAKKALAETINQNPVLKKAGVVDAGGRGYVVILEAMLASLRGEAVAPAIEAEESAPREKAVFSEFETGDIKFGYCTEFIVTRENDKDPQKLRQFLAPIGDSLVLVDDDEIIKVHVHTNCPGSVITEALTYGSLLTVKIENMREQHTEKIMHDTDAQEAEREAEAGKKYGVVAVCAGAGLEAVFRDLGADGVISGGQTMNPSTEDILREIKRTPAETVFVLPNNKNIIMAAEQCVGLTEKKVVVVPTKTVPQGVSALLEFDASLGEAALEEALLAGAARVHTASVTYAARDSEYDGRSIKAGEYLTLLEGKLLDTAADMAAAADGVGQALAQFSPEFVTLFYGEDVSEDAAEDAAEALRALLPGADITVVDGGQPVYYYIVSAE